MLSVSSNEVLLSDIVKMDSGLGCQLSGRLNLFCGTSWVGEPYIASNRLVPSRISTCSICSVCSVAR